MGIIEDKVSRFPVEIKEPNSQLEFLRGLAALRCGKYDEAITLFTKLLEENKKEVRYIRLGTLGLKVRYLLANCYMSRAEFARAEKILRQLHDELAVARKSRKSQGVEGSTDAETDARVEIARRIFHYMDKCFAVQDNKKEAVRYEWNPETNLLKGYYTLYTGTEPGAESVTDKEADLCLKISEEEGTEIQNQALLKVFPYFRKACRLAEAFPSRYDLLNGQGMGNKARYGNEVERISVYIISLTKLQKLYQAKKVRIEDLYKKLKGEGKQEKVVGLFENGFEATKQQLDYLLKSKRDLERFLLNFPANYKISLKAAIALAEWLLDFDKAAEQATGREEERGAGAFNTLRDNSKFRFSTASQRRVFYALLLAMYKPIKALKEDCCFNTKDEERTPNLVHYTSMETLKKILTGEPQKEGLRFRINNCGYMNDVFEGKTFLKSIAMISDDITSMQEPMRSALVEKYFPQINRSHQDLLPSGSNVYIGSLSVKADSFPMWDGGDPLQ